MDITYSFLDLDTTSIQVMYNPLKIIKMWLIYIGNYFLEKVQIIIIWIRIIITHQDILQKLIFQMK